LTGIRRRSAAKHKRGEAEAARHEKFKTAGDYTTDCNAASGGTVIGRTSTTTALDCIPTPGAGHN